MQWTEELIEQVRQLKRDGLTTQQIADRMGQGLTKNAVVGVLHRGMYPSYRKPKPPKPPKHPAVRHTPKPPKSAPPPPPPLELAQNGYYEVTLDETDTNTLVEDPVLVENLPVVPVTFSAESARLLENLEPQHCRWPIGENSPYTFCCDQALEGSSYCEYHDLLGHVPNTRPVKASRYY